MGHRTSGPVSENVHAADDAEPAEPAEKTCWPELLGADGTHAQSIMAGAGKQAFIIKGDEVVQSGAAMTNLAWLAISLCMSRDRLDTCSK